MSSQVRKSWFVKKLGHFSSRFVAPFILLPDYIALSWLCHVSHDCSALLDIWAIYW